MTLPRPTGWLPVALAVAAGCHTAPTTDPVVRANGAATAAAASTVAPAEAPPPAVTAPRPATPLLVKQLDSRLTIMASQSPAGRDALIQFGVIGGTLIAAPGLAEMTAHVLAEGGDPSQDRPGLSQAITRLGGTLVVQAGPVTTWLDIRVPGERWADAVAALRAALEEPQQSRGQIERLREGFVTQRCQAIQRDPVGVMAHRLLLGDRSTVEHVNELLDRDPSEVATFVSRAYRPDQAILAVEAPEDPARILTLVAKSGREGFSSWQPQAPLPGSAKLLDRQFPPGIHWAPGTTEGRCQVALVTMLPFLWQANAAPLLILHDCVTLDGTGGRLEKLQQQRNLGHIRWRSEVALSPDATALVLRTEATADEAIALWQVLGIARASLRDVPPTPSELALARRRAPLTGRLGALDAGARLRQQVQGQLRQLGYGQLDAAFAAIDQNGFDVKAAAADFQKLPTAMVVVGGSIPAGQPDVQTFQLLPAERPENPVSAPVAAGSDPNDNAGQWLERAVRALGGSSALQRLDGWEHEARWSHSEAPSINETATWRSDGRLRRTRRLLDARIDITLEGNEGSETLDTTTRSLAPPDIVQLRREQQRHPVALLAAHARGELQFRAVGQRPVGDREYMVVEAAGAMFDRLWLFIDVQSLLPRIVEVWEPLPDGSTIHLQDTWSDYRTIEGLRVPFYRQTTQNEGQNRIDITYQKWQPIRRGS